jgi:dihydroorotate dehydrogenase
MNNIQNIQEPRIIKLIPKKNMILLAKFENGIIKKIDMKKQAKKIKEYKILEDEKIFKNVHIENAGWVVVWNDMLDMDGAYIWEYGENYDAN